MEYNIKNIKDINDLEFPYGVPVKLRYSSEEFDYNLLIINKEKFNNLVVLSNGAVDVTKKFPPIFMRSSWSEEINASLIYLDDPTIHKTNLKLGWGQGNNREYVLEIYSQLVKKISEKLTIETNQVCYFGSSAGGFMSLILSSMHTGTMAVVNNPQTDVRNYHEGHSVPLLELCYGTVEKAYDNHQERVNVASAFKSINNVPQIYYLQNQYSSHDLKFHVNPFIKSMKEMELDIEKIIFINYFNKERGHTPLEKEPALNSLNLLISSNIF